MKKIGVFSDLHGDKKSLDLIVKTLHQAGVSSAIFLGDAVYKTMSDFTASELNKAEKIREELGKDSVLRKDILGGMFSDEQLQKYIQIKDKASGLAKKIAREEYLDVKKALGGLDLAVLGGNWDYAEEIAEVFGRDYLDASSKELFGLKIAGFSGGGSPSMMTAMDQTLADNQFSNKNKYHSWAEKLLSPESFDADLFISHLPFTDGEGKQVENGVEQLKAMVKQRKKDGRDVPGLYMWGHRHTSGKVGYDSELEGFVVSPGCSSRNHNKFLPTFMVCDFDGENRLQSIQRYEINAALEGLSEVRLAEVYSLDHARKKVFSEKKDQIVLEDKDRSSFRDNLLLDSASRLVLNVNYTGKTAEEKDLLLRKNLLKAQEKAEDTGRRITQALNEGKKILFRKKDKGKDCLREAVQKTKESLAGQAREIFSLGRVSYQDEKDKESWEDVLIEAAFKISPERLEHSLLNNAPRSMSESWGADLIEEGTSRIAGRYQKYALKNLNNADLQEMAELYVPAAYQQDRTLDYPYALKLWLQSHQEGLLTTAELEKSNAYSRKKDFRPKAKTMKEVGSLFGLENIEDKVKDASAEMKDAIKEAVSTGKVPVISDGQGDYVPLDGKKYYLDDSFKDLDYQARTKEKYIGDEIKAGRMLVIDKDGQEYAVDRSGMAMPIKNPSEFGLDPGSYAVLPYDKNLENADPKESSAPINTGMN